VGKITLKLDKLSKEWEIKPQSSSKNQPKVPKILLKVTKNNEDIQKHTKNIPKSVVIVPKCSENTQNGTQNVPKNSVGMVFTTNMQTRSQATKLMRRGQPKF